MEAVPRHRACAPDSATAPTNQDIVVLPQAHHLQPPHPRQPPGLHGLEQRRERFRPADVVALELQHSQPRPGQAGEGLCVWLAVGLIRLGLLWGQG